MVGKYFDGVLPAPGDYTNADLALQDLLVAPCRARRRGDGRLDFSAGIVAVKEFVDAVNGYVTEQEPWVLAKDPATAERLATVLYTICESLRAIAVLYHPVMPDGDRLCGTARRRRRPGAASVGTGRPLGSVAGRSAGDQGGGTVPAAGRPRDAPVGPAATRPAAGTGRRHPLPPGHRDDDGTVSRAGPLTTHSRRPRRRSV